MNFQLRRGRRKQVTLRTRLASGTRTAYAIVTPTYSPFDSDELVRAVAPVLGDARAELVYDGSRVSGTALWMPDRIVDLAAGDIFKAGVRLQTDDTGRGRIRVSGVVWRNRCLNLIVIGEGEVEAVSQVHRGSPEHILDTVREGVNHAREKVADFLESWGRARTVRVDVTTLLRAWVEERRLQVPGVRTAEQRDAVVEALLTAWEKEPGETLADAVNSVTRAAHENPMWGIDIREELERQAARLVLVPR